MARPLLFIILLIAVSLITLAQTTAFSPKPGTALRKALMDALREPMLDELQQLNCTNGLLLG